MVCRNFCIAIAKSWGGFTVKSLRTLLLLSRISGLLVAVTALSAQNASQPAASASPPKYRTHFLIYNVQQRTTNTLFTIDGEWHAPNWAPKGQYIVSDMGGELYRIPVSGSNAGKPEKINVSLRMMITNDDALSWDGKQIAVTGITPPMPAKIRTPADIHNPLFPHESGRDQYARGSSGLAAWVVARRQVRCLHSVPRKQLRHLPDQC
jgi:hypothetical protein